MPFAAELLSDLVRVFRLFFKRWACFPCGGGPGQRSARRRLPRMPARFPCGTAWDRLGGSLGIGIFLKYSGSAK